MTEQRKGRWNKLLMVVIWAVALAAAGYVVNRNVTAGGATCGPLPWSCPAP